MSDTISETEACELLSRLFRARGYAIVRSVDFHEYGVSFHADGWDADARVGFEFLTSEDEDHDDLTLDEYKTLMAAQQRGELSLFIIDEVEPLSAADLTATAHEFLDEVADAAAARRTRASRRTGRARKKVPVKRRAKAAPARKTASGKGAAIRKTTAKKTVAGRKPAKKTPAKKTPAKKTPARKPAKAVRKPSGRKPATRR